MSVVAREETKCMRTLFAWLKHNCVDVELNKLLLLMRGFSVYEEADAFSGTPVVHYTCLFDHFLLARSVACFLISCKLFEVLQPSIEGCLTVLKKTDLISKEDFASLVRAEERMIVRDCAFDFLYTYIHDNGKEEHLHSMLGKTFDGKRTLFFEVLECFINTQHQSVRWPMTHMWKNVNQLAEGFPVQGSTVIHAYMTTFMAWQKMKLWDSNLSL